MKRSRKLVDQHVYDLAEFWVRASFPTCATDADIQELAEDIQTICEDFKPGTERRQGVDQ